MSTKVYLAGHRVYVNIGDRALRVYVVQEMLYTRIRVAKTSTCIHAQPESMHFVYTSIHRNVYPAQVQSIPLLDARMYTCDARLRLHHVYMFSKVAKATYTQFHGAYTRDAHKRRHMYTRKTSRKTIFHVYAR